MNPIASAFVLGLSAGVSPGPLLALLVGETLRHGLGAGVRVSLAPLITDLPIVVVVFVLLAQLARTQALLGALALAGALLLVWLGTVALRYRPALAAQAPAPPRSLRKAVATNFLNPNPYLFWLLVGGPTVTRAWQAHPGEALAFVVVFYALLIGIKLALALLVSRSRHLLQGAGYVWTVRATGVLLLAYALVFAVDGARLLASGR